MLLSDIMDVIDDDSDAFDLVESAQFEVENASDSLRTAVEILEMEADLED
ncbi:MAG: hypothetical protein Q4A32_02640 [Lachnospiraceae bacterium]|nr:hypothetical protein [Lachnospiraceae bacterium]